MEAPKRAIKCEYFFLANVPMCSVKSSYAPTVSANGFWSGIFTDNGTRKNTQAIAFLTGCCAGGTESFVVTPFELVKIRLQDKASSFNGPIDVLRQAIKAEGVTRWVVLFN